MQDVERCAHVEDVCGGGGVLDGVVEEVDPLAGVTADVVVAHQHSHQLPVVVKVDL